MGIMLIKRPLFLAKRGENLGRLSAFFFYLKIQLF